ncbi:MAG TPA: OmpA family protein [Alphaproteobacteria bacterium]|nr:OmpA family protein [Alphaproteobacteria bacterium]
MRKAVAYRAGASILALCACAFGGTGASAQTPADVPVAGQLEEIVVTARKQEEKLQTTPVSVTAFSAAMLEKQNIMTVERISNFAPNVEITQAAGTASAAEVYIRGIGQADYELYIDPPVSMYVDGVLMARPVTTLLDLVDLERIDVLRGPQGTLFGRNTTGGAINVFTKGPSNEFGIEQKLGYGSDDEFVSRTILNTGEIADTGLKAKFAFSHHQRDGWIRNLNVSPDHDPGKLDTNGIWFDLHGDFGEQFSFDYRADYTEIYSQPITSEMTVARPDITRYFSRSPSYGGDPFQISPHYQDTVRLPANQLPDQHDEILGHSLTLNYDLSDAVRIKDIVAYRSVAMDEHPPQGEGNMRGLVFNPSFPGAGLSVAEVNPFYTLHIHDRQYQISNEFQLTGTFDRFRYAAGLYYFEENGSGKNANFFTYVAAPTFGVNTVTNRIYGLDSKSYAAYGQGSYTPPILDDKAEITFGMRYTRDEKTLSEADYSDSSPNVLGRLKNGAFQNLANNWHNLSWLTTLKYQWTDNLMTYFTASTGYKSGGYNPGALQAPYNPELATAYEAGIKSEWFDKRLRINATAFQTDYDDAQINQFIVTPSGSLATVVTNAGKATYRGGELEITALVGDGWQLDTAFGYVDPQYKVYMTLDPNTGQQINVADQARFPYVSNASLSVGVQYEFPPMDWGDLTARVDYSYKSARVFFPLNSLNPFNDAVGSGDYHDLSARLLLANIPVGAWAQNVKSEFFVTNLLDRHERIAGIDFGALGFGTDTYNRPRAFGFSITADFGAPSEAPAAAPPAYVPPPIQAPAAPKSYLVFFDFNKSDLTPQATQIVDTAAKNAQAGKVTQLTVTGHTDTVGSDAYNMRLSRRRAESVAAQLEKDGVASSEISIVAKGKRDLLVPTADGVREPQNRRVQIVFDGGPTS